MRWTPRMKGTTALDILRLQNTRRDVLKSMAVGTVAAIVGESCSGPTSAQGATSRKLPRVSLDAAGVSPDAILAFIDAVDEKVGGLHSFMLLRHGKVTAEGWWAPYAPALPHM